MGITKNSSNVQQIYKNGQNVSKVYKGGSLVFEYVEPPEISYTNYNYVTINYSGKSTGLFSGGGYTNDNTLVLANDKVCFVENPTNAKGFDIILLNKALYFVVGFKGMTFVGLSDGLYAVDDIKSLISWTPILPNPSISYYKTPDELFVIVDNRLYYTTDGVSFNIIGSTNQKYYSCSFHSYDKWLFMGTSIGLYRIDLSTHTITTLFTYSSNVTGIGDIAIMQFNTNITPKFFISRITGDNPNLINNIISTSLTTKSNNSGMTSFYENPKGVMFSSGGSGTSIKGNNLMRADGTIYIPQIALNVGYISCLSPKAQYIYAAKGVENTLTGEITNYNRLSISGTYQHNFNSFKYPYNYVWSYSGYFSYIYRLEA